MNQDLFITNGVTLGNPLKDIAATFEKKQKIGEIMKKNSEKIDLLEELLERGEEMTEEERTLFVHRRSVKLKYGDETRAEELIEKIGIEEAIKLSTREFLRRVETETSEKAD